MLRSKGIDDFEERELIEIGVAGANSPDAVFTQFPDSFATPLASLAQLAKIIWQRDDFDRKAETFLLAPV